MRIKLISSVTEEENVLRYIGGYIMAILLHTFKDKLETLKDLYSDDQKWQRNLRSGQLVLIKEDLGTPTNFGKSGII